MYMIFDYYEHLDGQPLTCIIQIDEEQHKQSGQRIDLPDYVDIVKEITDKPDYAAHTFAQRNYKMSEEDKEKTKIKFN